MREKFGNARSILYVIAIGVLILVALSRLIHR